MLTVLFVLIAIVAAVKVIAVFDTQRDAADINAYLRYEYQMDTSAQTPFAQLRSI